MNNLLLQILCEMEIRVAEHNKEWRAEPIKKKTHNLL